MIDDILTCGPTSQVDKTPTLRLRSRARSVGGRVSDLHARAIAIDAHTDHREWRESPVFDHMITIRLGFMAEPCWLTWK